MMNRGRRRDDIFKNDGDYRLFLEVLKDTVKIWNLKVSAYCLMSNHYHLLVHTPEGNLSRCMRHLNGVYTQRFNRRHGFDGQLFRGRYKAVLVEDDSYLIELVRYIHRNPLVAGIVSELALYNWSSHQAYMACEERWDWLYIDKLLQMFSESRSSALEEYLAYVYRTDSEEIQNFFSHKKLPSVLGSVEFIDKIRKRFNFKSADKEIPRKMLPSVDVETVIKVVCDVCRITEEELFFSRRGVANPHRDLAIYTLRIHTFKTLSEIGFVFEVKHYSTVSTAIGRVKKALDTKPEFLQMIKEIEARLMVSQQQT